jgi:hypothetical protein
MVDRSASVLANCTLGGLGQLTGDWLAVLSDLLSPSLAFAALALAIGAVTREKISKKDRMSIVWLCFALGTLSWFLAEVVWDLYPLYWGIQTPFPSIADAFGIAGYIPAVAGLLVLVWPFRSVFHSRNIVAGSLLTLVVVLSLSAPLILQETLALDVLAVGLAYVILDVLVLSISVPTLMIVREGSFWKPFMLLTSGIIFVLFAHLMSPWGTVLGSYYLDQLSYLLLDCGYLLAATGFYMRMVQLSKKLL